MEHYTNLKSLKRLLRTSDYYEQATTNMRLRRTILARKNLQVMALLGSVSQVFLWFTIVTKYKD